MKSLRVKINQVQDDDYNYDFQALEPCAGYGRTRWIKCKQMCAEVVDNHVCEWKSITDNGMDHYDQVMYVSQCGGVLIEHENYDDVTNFKYCPYCQGKINFE